MSKVKVIEEKVPYTKMNGRRSNYDLLEVDGYTITKDKTDKVMEERYRPRIIDELLVPKQLKDKLKYNIKDGHIPDTLLYSQAGGTGKTTISGVLANETKRDFITISANLDGGIQVIRDKVKGFASTKSMYGDKKIILLEEIGDLSAKALDLLKSAFDQYSSNATLIMTTNSMSNISQPLQTRFNIIDFNKVQDEDQQPLLREAYKRMLAILEVEQVEYNVKDVQFLLKKYKFSFRELIKNLGNSIIDGKLVVDEVDVSQTDLNNILTIISNGDLVELAKISDSINVVTITEELSQNFLTLLKEAKHVPNFIIHINELQKAIQNNAPFLGISFLAFANYLIKDNIKFRV